MDGIHLAQLSRLVQRRQQVQKPLALGLVLTVQGDLGAYGGGQQTAAIDGGVSRRAGFLLHDLSAVCIDRRIRECDPVAFSG